MVFFSAISNIKAGLGLDSSFRNGTYRNDLNDIDTTSFYYADTDASNKPIDVNGYVTTYKLDNNYKKQIFYLVSDNTTYLRTKNNGTWSSWDKVTNSNAVYCPTIETQSSHDDLKSWIYYYRFNLAPEKYHFYHIFLRFNGGYYVPILMYRDGWDVCYAWVQDADVSDFYYCRFTDTANTWAKVSATLA